MKQKILLLISMFVIATANAQDPDFSQDFTLNKTLLNPAYGAKYDFTSFNLTNNKLWLYPQAPQRSTFTFMTKMNMMGGGLNFEFKSQGSFYTLALNVNYFFDITLSPYSNTHLSMGITGGMFQDYLNTANFLSLNQDPLLMDQRALSRFYPQVAAGAMLYNDIFEFGVSATRLLPNSGYFYLNRVNILPPAIIMHGAYYYTQYRRLFSFATDWAAIISKEDLYFRINGSYYFRSPVKLGAGLSSYMYFPSNILNVNLHFLFTLRMINSIYLTYEASVNSLTKPIPTVAKFGNAVSLRVEFYKDPHLKPDFY